MYIIKNKKYWLVMLISTLITHNVLAMDLETNHPDTCVIQSTSDGVHLHTMNTNYGTSIEIYGPRAFKRTREFKDHPMVAIVNANRVASFQYDKLRNHLLFNGYMVLQINRNNSSDDSAEQITDILDAMQTIYGSYLINGTSPLGLIGHSVGGGVVMQMSKRIYDEDRPFNIQALITLAPNVDVVFETEEPLDAFDTPAYLSLYGSQDMDVTGINHNHDAFAAYDYVGNEYSTMNADGSTELFNLSGQLFKSMIYIHGADHMGLIGSDWFDGNNSEDYQFIGTDDQFCITKTYVTAFLHWRLKDILFYKNYLTPPYVYPQSVQQITSESPDYMGFVNQTNPAGSPVRMFFQTSPIYKENIFNFEPIVPENSGTMVLTTPGDPVLGVQLGKYAFHEDPFYIRNVTQKALLAWELGTEWKQMGFSVTESNKNTTQFTHLSLRIAQIWNADYFPEMQGYANTPGEYADFYLSLEDAGGQIDYIKLGDYGDIPFNDVRASGVSAHTALSTISVPLNSFSGINLQEISMIRIHFNPNSSGAILLDNIEWVKY